MLNDLAEIVAIPSTLDTAEPKAPFGANCRKALDWFLAKAQSYGFATGELDGYCGWAEYGEGERCIGVLCHLDVVPAGDGWTYPPYELTNDGGMLYGRGVVDDKGSVVMCLHALAAIKKSGVKLSHRIRIIAGCNEEHGSACIKHYVKNAEIPLMSFVPDSDFPIINSEKGILQLMISLPLDKFFSKNIAYICGGESTNVVPDKAKISIFADSDLARKLHTICGGDITDDLFKRPELVGTILAAGHHSKDYSIVVSDDVITIEASGVSGHAMEPDKSDNAIWKLFHLLEALTDNSEIVNMMNTYICTPIGKDKLGIACEDEQSGDLTMSMGIINVDDDYLHFSLDMRLPISADKDEIQRKLLAALMKGAKIESIKYAPNLFIDKNDKLITTLLDVYHNVTGRNAHCLKCGGGTYARELPNAVAFGPTFENTVTNIHNIDEHVSVEEFYKAAEVYREAMIALAK